MKDASGSGSSGTSNGAQPPPSRHLPPLPTDGRRVAEITFPSPTQQQVQGPPVEAPSVTRRNTQLGMIAMPRLRVAFNVADTDKCGGLTFVQFKAFVAESGLLTTFPPAQHLPEVELADIFHVAFVSQQRSATRKREKDKGSERIEVKRPGKLAEADRRLNFYTLVEWYGTIVAAMADKKSASPLPNAVAAGQRGTAQLSAIQPPTLTVSIPDQSGDGVAVPAAAASVGVQAPEGEETHMRFAGASTARPASAGLTKLQKSLPTDAIREFFRACLSRGGSAVDTAAGDGESDTEGDACQPLETPRRVALARWRELDTRGYTRAVMDLIAAASANPNLNLDRALAMVHEAVAAQALESSMLEANASTGSSGSATSGMPGSRQRSRRKVRVTTAPTVAFTSALSLYHLHNNPDAHLPIDAAVVFVDISGYSSVSAALEDGGPHQLAQVVNSYLERIVATVVSCGGDVVKFAGDALIALWYTEFHPINVRAAAHCAVRLQTDHKVFPIPGSPDLFFQLHIGISEGTVYSRVFAPRKFSTSNKTPSHFHFVSGEPMMTATIACDAAPRGKIFVTGEVAACLEKSLDSGSAASAAAKGTNHSGDAGPPGSDVAAFAKSSAWSLQFDLRQVGVKKVQSGHGSAAAANQTFVAVPLHELVGVSDGGADAGSDSPAKKNRYKPPRAPQKMSEGRSETVFIPPHIVENMDSGLDQFYLAEMRELVVFFIHFSGSTDEEIWFDELHTVLDNHGAACVQIIDDDKGVHVVAAINLYNISHGAADTAGEIVQGLMTRVPDTRIGVAAGTVLCGVLGSAKACQWDITGPACVRACRLMQDAVANDVFVLFDASVFNAMRDKSRLQEPHMIHIKGSADPVPVCTLHKDGFGSGSWRRHSKISLLTTLPNLYFSVDLCPDVHREIVSRVRHLLFVVPTQLNIQASSLLSSMVQIDGSNPGTALQSSNSITGVLSPKLSVVASPTLQQFLSSPALRKTPAGRVRDFASAAAAAAASAAGGAAPPPTATPPSATASQLNSSSSRDAPPIGPALASAAAAATPPNGVPEMETLTRTVVLHGPKGSGKLSACMNILRDTEFVPVVHVCFSRLQHVQLDVGRTIANWFTSHTNDEVRQHATATLKALHSGQTNSAFKLLMLLIAKATSLMSVAFIIRQAQFIDAGSAAFIGALNTRFRANTNLVIMVTTYPVYPNPSPTKVFMAYTGVAEFEVAQMAREEVGKLMEFKLRCRCTPAAVQAIGEKSAYFVTFVMELLRHAEKMAMFSQLPSGELTLLPKAAKDVSDISWSEISKDVVHLTVHLLDFLTPTLRLLAKVVCAITEQPLISAFFYSVARCCQLMIGYKFNPEDAELLQQLRILEMCEHRCTAHSGTGELDAAVFYLSPMRDIVQGLLVPAQRTQINAICAAAYSDTHPMDHPLQFLVRARHYLFASDRAHYLDDIRAGWQLIVRGAFNNGKEKKEKDRLKATFRNWLSDLALGELEDFMVKEDIEEVRVSRARLRLRLNRQRSSGVAVEATLRWLGDVQRTAWPLVLGPPRDDLQCALHTLKLIAERVFVVRQSVDSAAIGTSHAAAGASSHLAPHHRRSSNSDVDSNATSAVSTPREATVTVPAADLGSFCEALHRYVAKLRSSTSIDIAAIKDKCREAHASMQQGQEQRQVARREAHLNGVPFVDEQSDTFSEAPTSRRSSHAAPASAGGGGGRNGNAAMVHFPDQTSSDDEEGAIHDLVALTDALTDGHIQQQSSTSGRFSLIGEGSVARPSDTAEEYPAARADDAASNKRRKTNVGRTLDTELVFRGLEELVSLLHGPAATLLKRHRHAIAGIPSVGTAGVSSPLARLSTSTSAFEAALSSADSVAAALTSAPPSDFTCTVAERFVNAAIAALKGHCETQLPLIIDFAMRRPFRSRVGEAAFWMALCNERSHAATASSSTAGRGGAGVVTLLSTAPSSHPPPRVREAAIVVARVLMLLSDRTLHADKTALMLLFGHLPLIQGALLTCGNVCPVASEAIAELERRLGGDLPPLGLSTAPPPSSSAEPGGSGNKEAPLYALRYTASEMLDSLSRAILLYSRELKERESRHEGARRQFVTFFALWLRFMCT